MSGAAESAVIDLESARVAGRVGVGLAVERARLALVDAEGKLEWRVRARLELDGFVVASTAGSVDAVVAGYVDRPDAVVLRTELSPLERPRGLRELCGMTPPVPALVVAVGGGGHAVRRALSAGARAVVRETDVERALVPSLLAMLAGQVCSPAEVGEEFDRPVFSYRERQVLDFVARGLTNQEIAEKLYLAESTVKSHLSTSFRKLGVKSRAQAASLVLDPSARADLGLMPTVDEELSAFAVGA